MRRRARRMSRNGRNVDTAPGNEPLCGSGTVTRKGSTEYNRTRPHSRPAWQPRSQYHAAGRGITKGETASAAPSGRSATMPIDTTTWAYSYRKETGTRRKVYPPWQWQPETSRQSAERTGKTGGKLKDGNTKSINHKNRRTWKTNNYLWSMLAAATFTATADAAEDKKWNNRPWRRRKDSATGTASDGSGVSTKATGSALPTQKRREYGEALPQLPHLQQQWRIGECHTDRKDNTTSATTINCTPATNCTGIGILTPHRRLFSGVLNPNPTLRRERIEPGDAQTVGDCLLQRSERRRKTVMATPSLTLGAGINTGTTARLSRLVARVSVSGIRTEFDPNDGTGGILRTEKHLCAECREKKLYQAREDTAPQNGTHRLSDRKLHRLQPGTVAYLQIRSPPR